MYIYTYIYIYIDKSGCDNIHFCNFNINMIPHSEAQELSPTVNLRKFCLSDTLMKITIHDKLHYFKYSNDSFHFGIYKQEMSFTALLQYRY
jgi:hypothetical protein